MGVNNVALFISTVLVIIKWTKNPVPLRLHCGSGKLILFIISSWFAIFKNVVHCLELCETRLGVSPGSKLCAMFLNDARYFKTVRCGCGAVAVFFQFT